MKKYTEQIRIGLDKDTFKEMHDMMGTSVKDKNGFTVLRLFESKHRQDWYRNLIYRGMNAMREEWLERVKEKEDELKDSY